MPEHVIVWDLETVPDLDAVARAHHLPEPAVEVAREVLGEKFPKLPFHQIVCIGAVVAEKVDGVWWVTAIGAPHIGERSEKELIAAFVEKIAALKPRLVTYNGTSFDRGIARCYIAFLRQGWRDVPISNDTPTMLPTFATCFRPSIAAPK